MSKLINRENYALIKAFLGDMAEIKPVSESTVERYGFYLRHLLLWAMDVPFAKAYTIRPTLPVYVSNQEGNKGKKLAAETQKKIIGLSRRFFEWAKSRHTGAFKKLPVSWIERLHPVRRKEASFSQEHVFVSVEEAVQLATLPREEGNLAMWRDCAMAARLFLSGERASAAVTSPICAIDFDDLSIRQWPELGVRTKNSKKATTYLLPLPELLEVARFWDAYVRERLLPMDTWYAPIESRWGEQSLSLAEAGKNRNQALNRRLKLLFDKTNLPYKSAHKFRHGHAVFGLLHADSPADYKAVSMNLMHSDIKVTDSIYAILPDQDVKARIARLASNTKAQSEDELHQFIKTMNKAEVSKVLMMLAQRLAA